MYNDAPQARIVGTGDTATLDNDNDTIQKSRQEYVDAFKRLATKQTNDTAIKFSQSKTEKDAKFTPDSYVYIPAQTKPAAPAKLYYTDHSLKKSEVTDPTLMGEINRLQNEIIARQQAHEANRGIMNPNELNADKQKCINLAKNKNDEIIQLLKDHRAQKQRLQEYRFEQKDDNINYIYSSGATSYKFELNLKDNTPPSISSKGPANETDAEARVRLTKLIEILKKYGDDNGYQTPYKFGLDSSNDKHKKIMEDICKKDYSTDIVVIKSKDDKPNKNNENDDLDEENNNEADHIQGYDR